MDHACTVNEVKQPLKEAGEQLALTLSSTKDLLALLDKTEQLLILVGQAPSISMQAALVPSMGALIRDELLKHSDVDVKVAVASCLCEVARITAPEPPYKDEIMKDIFQLNVLAFGELSNVTGRSYYKAIHILESVSKVKSCLLMLDLECDDLILEMFEQFLSRIRTNHPQSVFSDMESIMTLVIEESDEIASELLSLLISHVRKENQNVSPAPWKLAEKVLRNCYDTLKPYHQTLMEFIEADPDGYAEVVTALCQNNPCPNELVVTKPIKTNKRDADTYENGGSKKTLLPSHSKKQKHTETQRVSSKTDRKLDEDYRENHPAKGRPKNKKSSNQETNPKSVQGSKIELRKTRFQDKSLQEKSKGIKGNLRISEKEDKKDKGIKYGKELVGRRIKVWWPLDETYYEGAVSAYNAADNKHKVLYADGDEEVLDLRLEKWKIVADSSHEKQEEQAADLSSPMTTSSVKRIKQKGKQKPEMSQTQEKNPTKEDDIKGVTNPVETPGISSELKIIKGATNPVETPGVSSELKIIKEASNPVDTPGVSSELKISEKVEEEGEPKIPTTELKEEEETKVLEKNQDVVSETLQPKENESSV